MSVTTTQDTRKPIRRSHWGTLITTVATAAVLGAAAVASGSYVVARQHATAALAEALSHSIVQVTTEHGGQVQLSTGTVLNPRGDIITTVTEVSDGTHASAEHIFVTVPGEGMVPARVVGSDHLTGLAVVRVGKTRHLTPAKFDASAAAAQSGRRVTVATAPVYAWDIASTRVEHDTSVEADFTTTSAVGAAGSVVVGAGGSVLGIEPRHTGGLPFALPTSEVLHTVDGLLGK